MKLFKKVKLPSEVIQALVQCYDWGYTDAQKGLPKKDPDALKESFERGFDLGLKKRGVKV